MFKTHIVDTEVREFDEALDIIKARQKYANKKSTSTLKQQLSRANLHARLQKQFGKVSLAGGQHSVPSHPLVNRPPSKPDQFKTLPLEEKYEKIKEFYATGNFKPGELAYRFGVKASIVKNLIWGEDWKEILDEAIKRHKHEL